MQSTQTNNRRILVIGIGNEFRSDDAVGLIVARKLKSYIAANIDIRESGGGISLLDLWEEYSQVIAIDAISSDATPGSIHRFEVHREAIAADSVNSSTHAFSIAEVVEMAKVLGKLPPYFVIYGIVGENFQQGMGLSNAVATAVERVVKRLIEEELPCMT